MPTKIKLILIAAALLLGGFFFGRDLLQGNQKDLNQEVKEKITVYKSPTCGCCTGYVAYLEKQGYQVEVVETKQTESIKEEHQIPHDMQSCHTTIIGDYFVEGHVPIEAVNKLMEEKPEIDGIALPAMPAGSPGMPGAKRGEFRIFSLQGGMSSEFMSL